MSTEFKRVRDYELMVVFHPELSEEDLASESQKVEAHITSVDGTVRLVNREAPWGRRRLAYPIRHGSRDVRDGVYVLYYFTSESGKLADIEREIKLQNQVLRYLLTLQSAPVMEPTPSEGEEAQVAGEEGTPAAADTATENGSADVAPEQPSATVAENAESAEAADTEAAESTVPAGSDEVPAATDTPEETPA